MVAYPRTWSPGAIAMQKAASGVLLVFALGLMHSAAGVQTGYDNQVDLCGSSPNRVCDGGFEADVFGGASNGKTVIADNGVHAELTVLRWKCKCLTCTSSSNCPAKCSRAGSQDIVQYYEFKAAYCKTAKLDTMKRKATTDRIRSLFSAHSVERMEDMLASQGQNSQEVWQLGSGAGSAPSCENDESRCIDFSMNPADCVHATFNQLQQLIKSAGYNDFEAYMKHRALVYGLSEDCIEGVSARFNWGESIVNRTDLVLPDGRTDRKLWLYGVPRYDYQIRKYGVKPQDASNVAFVTLQLTGTGWSDKPHDFRAKAALQVKMCKDGSVEGLGSTMPLMRDDMCGGVSFTAVDALFRDAVAFSRFELVKMRTENTATVCTEAGWDGMQCLNNIFATTPRAQCALVDVTSIDSSMQLVSDNKAVGLPKSFSTCFDGRPDAGKCTLRVCHDQLEFALDWNKRVDLSWKSPVDGSNKTLSVAGNAANAWISDAGCASGKCTQGIRAGAYWTQCDLVDGSCGYDVYTPCTSTRCNGYCGACPVATCTCSSGNRTPATGIDCPFSQEACGVCDTGYHSPPPPSLAPTPPPTSAPTQSCDTLTDARKLEEPKWCGGVASTAAECLQYKVTTDYGEAQCAWDADESRCVFGEICVTDAPTTPSPTPTPPPSPGCEENVCVCSVAGRFPATGTDCAKHGEETCAPLCVCDGGTPITGSACHTEGATVCDTTAGCNSGYTMVGTACRARQCTCQNGVAATATDCPNEGDAKCATCHPGYELDGAACEASRHCSELKETAQCSTATTIVECSEYKSPTSNGDVHRCQWTSDAEEEECIQGGIVCRQCTCSNGIGATDMQCHSDGEEKCESCDDGFHPVGYPASCAANVCICTNGEATADCTIHGANKCATCNDSYQLNGDSCTDNQCTCSNGVGAVGTDCPTSGDAKCTSCDPGYHIDGVTCAVNQCTCSNGTPTSGTECSSHGESECSSCDDHYTLFGSPAQCAAVSCTCDDPNGFGATLADCPNDGDAKCGGCNPGYRYESSPNSPGTAACDHIDARALADPKGCSELDATTADDCHQYRMDGFLCEWTDGQCKKGDLSPQGWSCSGTCTKDCTNVPLPFHAQKGWTCTSAEVLALLPEKCVNAPVWVNQQYCAHSCASEGYGYDGHDCQPLCTCSNGSHAHEGHDCPEDGASKCISCDPGFHLSGTSCEADQDCVGTWSDCDGDCQRTFTVATAAIGDFGVCEAEDGAEHANCEPGMQSCTVSAACDMRIDARALDNPKWCGAVASTASECHKYKVMKSSGGLGLCEWRDGACKLGVDCP